MKEKQISLTALYLYLTTVLAAIASAVLLSAFNLIKANAADLKPEIQSSAQLSLILTTATVFLILAVASAFAYLIFYVLTYIKNNQITKKFDFVCFLIGFFIPIFALIFIVKVGLLQNKCLCKKRCNAESTKN